MYYLHNYVLGNKLTIKVIYISTGVYNMTWPPNLLFHQLHMWKYKALYFIKNFEVKMELAYKKKSHIHR